MSAIARQLAMTVGTPMRQPNASLLFDAQQASDTDTPTIFNLARNGLTELVKDHSVFSHFTSNIFREIPPFNFDIETYRDDLKAFLLLITPIILRKDVHKCLEFLIRAYKIHTHAWAIEILVTAMLPYSTTALFPRFLNLCDFTQTPALAFFTRMRNTHQGFPRSTIALATRNDSNLLHFLTSSCFDLCSLDYVQHELAKNNIKGVPTTFTNTVSSNVLASFITLVLIDIIAMYDTNQLPVPNNVVKTLLSFISKCLSANSSISHAITTSNLSVGAYMVLTHLCGTTRLEYNVLTTMLSLVLPSVPFDASPRTLMYPLLCLVSILKSQRLVLLDKSLMKTTVKVVQTVGTAQGAVTIRNQRQVELNKSQTQDEQAAKSLPADHFDSYIIMLPLDIIRALVRMKHLREAITLLYNAKGYDISQFIAAFVIGLAKYLLIPVDSTDEKKQQKNLIVNVPFFELLLHICETTSHTSIIDSNCMTALLGTVLYCFAKSVGHHLTIRGTLTASAELTLLFTKYLQLFFSTINYNHPDLLQSSIQDLFHVLQAHPNKSDTIFKPHDSPHTMNDEVSPVSEDGGKSKKKNHTRRAGYFLDFLHNTSYDVLIYVLSVGLQSTKHQLLMSAQSSAAFTITQALTQTEDVNVKLQALSQLNDVISGLQGELYMYYSASEGPEKQQTQIINNNEALNSTPPLNDLADELAFLDQGLFGAAETPQSELKAEKRAKDEHLAPTIASTPARLSPEEQKQAEIVKMSPNVLSRHIKQTQSVLDDSVHLLLQLMLTETNLTVLTQVFKMTFWKQLSHHFGANFTPEEQYTYMSKILTSLCLCLEKFLSVFNLDTTDDSLTPFQASLQLASDFKAEQLAANSNTPKVSTQITHSVAQVHKVFFVRRCTEQLLFAALTALLPLVSIIHHQFPAPQSTSETQLPSHTMQLIPYFTLLLALPQQPVITRLLSTKDPLVKSIDLQNLRLSLTFNSPAMYAATVACCRFLSGESQYIAHFAPEPVNTNKPGKKGKKGEKAEPVETNPSTHLIILSNNNIPMLSGISRSKGGLEPIVTKVDKVINKLLSALQPHSNTNVPVPTDTLEALKSISQEYTDVANEMNQELLPNAFAGAILAAEMPETQLVSTLIRFAVSPFTNYLHPNRISPVLTAASYIALSTINSLLAQTKSQQSLQPSTLISFSNNLIQFSRCCIAQQFTPSTVQQTADIYQLLTPFFLGVLDRLPNPHSAGQNIPYTTWANATSDTLTSFLSSPSFFNIPILSTTNTTSPQNDFSYVYSHAYLISTLYMIAVTAHQQSFLQLLQPLFSHVPTPHSSVVNSTPVESTPVVRTRSRKATAVPEPAPTATPTQKSPSIAIALLLPIITFPSDCTKSFNAAYTQRLADSASAALHLLSLQLKSYISKLSPTCPATPQDLDVAIISLIFISFQKNTPAALLSSIAKTFSTIITTSKKNAYINSTTAPLLTSLLEILSNFQITETGAKCIQPISISTNQYKTIFTALAKIQPHLAKLEEFGCFDSNDVLKITSAQKLKLFGEIKKIPLSAPLLHISTGYLTFIASVFASSPTSSTPQQLQQHLFAFCEVTTALQPFHAASPSAEPIIFSFKNFIAPSTTFTQNQHECYHLTRSTFTTTFTNLLNAILHCSRTDSANTAFLLSLLNTPLVLPQQSHHFASHELQYQTALFSENVLKFILSDTALFNTTASATKQAHQQLIFNSLLPLLNSNIKRPSKQFSQPDEAQTMTVAPLSPLGIAVNAFINKHSSYLGNLSTAAVATHVLSTSTTVGTDLAIDMGNRFDHLANEFSKSQAAIWFPTYPSTVTELLTRFTISSNLFASHLSSLANPTYTSTLSLLSQCLQFQYRSNTLAMTPTHDTRNRLDVNQLRTMKERVIVSEPWTLIPSIADSLTKVTDELEILVSQYTTRVEQQQTLIAQQVTDTRRKRQENSITAFATHNDDSGDYYDFMFEQELLIKYQHDTHALLTHIHNLYSNQFQLIDVLYHTILTSNLLLKTDPKSITYKLVQIHDYITPEIMSLLVNILNRNISTPQVDDIISMVAEHHELQTLLTTLEDKITGAAKGIRNSSIPIKQRWEIEQHFGLLDDKSRNTKMADIDDDDDDEEQERPLLRYNDHQQHQLAALHTINPRILSRETIAQLFSVVVDHAISNKFQENTPKVQKKIYAMISPLYSGFDTIIQHFMAYLSFSEYTLKVKTLGSGVSKTGVINFSHPLIRYQKNSMFTSANIHSSAIGLKHVVHNSPLDTTLRLLRSVIVPVLMLRSKNSAAKAMDVGSQSAGMLSFAHVLNTIYGYHEFINIQTLFILTLTTLQHASQYYINFFITHQPLALKSKPQAISSTMGDDDEVPTSQSSKKGEVLTESEVHKLLSQQIKRRADGITNESNSDFSLTQHLVVYDEPLDITEAQLDLHEQIIPDFLVSAIVLALSTASTSALFFNQLRAPSERVNALTLNSSLHVHQLSQLANLLLRVISPQQQITAVTLFHQYISIFPQLISASTDFRSITNQLVISPLDDGTSADIDTPDGGFTEEDAKFHHSFVAFGKTTTIPHDNAGSKSYSLADQLAMTSYHAIGFTSTYELILQHQSEVQSLLFADKNNANVSTVLNTAAINTQHCILNILQNFIESTVFTKCASEASLGVSLVANNRSEEALEFSELCQDYLQEYQDAMLSYMTLHTYIQHQCKRMKSLSDYAALHPNYFGKVLVQSLHHANEHNGIVSNSIQAILAVFSKQLTTLDFTKMFKNIFTHISLISSNPSGEITTAISQFKNPTLLHHVYSIQPLQTILTQQHFTKSGMKDFSSLGSILESFSPTNIVPANLIYQRLLTMFVQRLAFEREILFAESFVILLGSDAGRDKDTLTRAQTILQSELTEQQAISHVDQYYSSRRSTAANDDTATTNDNDFDLDLDDLQQDKPRGKPTKVKKSDSRRVQWLSSLKVRRSALLHMIPWLVNNIISPSLTTEYKQPVLSLVKSNSHWSAPIALPSSARTTSLEHLQIALLSLDELVGLAFSLFFPLDDPSSILKTMVFNHDHHRLGAIKRNEAFSAQFQAVPSDSAAILLTTCQVLFFTVQCAASQAFSEGEISKPGLGAPKQQSKLLANKKQKVTTQSTALTIATTSPSQIASPPVRRSWLAILCSALMCSSTILQRLQMTAIALVNKFTSFNLSILLKTISLLHIHQSPNTKPHIPAALPPDQLSMAQLSSLSFLHTLILVFGNMLQPFHLPIVFILCHPGTVLMQSEQPDTSNESQLNVLKYSANETALRSASLHIATSTTSYDEYDQEGDQQLVAIGEVGAGVQKNAFVVHSTSSILSSCIATFAVSTNPQLLLDLLINIQSIIMGLGPIAINRVLTFANHLIGKVSAVYAQARDRGYTDNVSEDIAEVEDALALEDYDMEDLYPSLLQLLLTILDSRTSKGGLELIVDQSAVITAEDADPEGQWDDEDHEDGPNPFASDNENDDLEGKEWNPFEDRTASSRKLMHDESDQEDELDDDDLEFGEKEGKLAQELFEEQQQLARSIQETGRIELHQRSQVGTDSFRHLWVVSLEQVLTSTTALTSSAQASYQLQWTEFELALIEADAISVLNDVVLMLDEQQLESLVISLSQWVNLSSYPDLPNTTHPGPKGLIHDYNTFDDVREAHRQSSIAHLQRQIHGCLSRYVVFVKICHQLLHSTRHLFIPIFLEHCAGYLISTLAPLNTDVQKEFVLRKKSQQANKCFKHKELIVDLQADGTSTKAVKFGSAKSRLDDTTYAVSSSNNKKRKLVSSASEPAPVSSPSSTVVITSVATQLLLHTTWYSQCIVYCIDILRVMLLIDISYVQSSSVDRPHASSHYSHRNPSAPQTANPAAKKKGKRFNNNNNTKHATPAAPATIVVQSIFRELLPKPFVEQAVVLILAQLQHGHKLRQFLPSQLVPATITEAIAPIPGGSSGDIAYLNRQKHFLVLALPVIKSETLQATPALPYTLVSPGDNVPIFRQHKNLLVYSSYIEQLLIPTINTLAEYLHSTQPLLWENITSLLSTGCYSKYLQIRFASLSSFQAILQPQICAQALITANGGSKAGYVQSATSAQRSQRKNTAKEQPQWSNEFFHACISLFVPTITELMQDPSVHVQRLSQTVVRLTETIGGESFSKYLQ